MCIAYTASHITKIILEGVDLEPLDEALLEDKFVPVLN
jgi:hypothetical protein